MQGIPVNEICAEDVAFNLAVNSGIRCLMKHKEVEMPQLRNFIDEGVQTGVKTRKKEDDWVGLYGLTHAYFSDMTLKQYNYLSNTNMSYASDDSELIVKFTVFEALMLFLGSENYDMQVEAKI